MPTLYIIAGPDGAGKSAFASRYLPEEAGEREFINVDWIARGMAPFRPESAMVEAGKIALSRMKRLVRDGQSFAWESTLSALSLKSRIVQAKAAGYSVKLIFIWIQSLEAAVQRARRRAMQDGAPANEAEMAKSFLKSVRHFFKVYSPLADGWKYYNNSGAALQLVAMRRSPSGATHVSRETLQQCVEAGVYQHAFELWGNVSVVEDWSDDFLDLEDWKELRAFQNAQLDALRRARRFDSEFIVLEAGKILALAPNQTADIERDGESNLVQINKNIAALENTPAAKVAVT